MTIVLTDQSVFYVPWVFILYFSFVLDLPVFFPSFIVGKCHASKFNAVFCGHSAQVVVGQILTEWYHPRPGLCNSFWFLFLCTLPSVPWSSTLLWSPISFETLLCPFLQKCFSLCSIPVHVILRIIWSPQRDK